MCCGYGSSSTLRLRAANVLSHRENQPPAMEDFYAYQALGIQPLNAEPATLRLASGVSVYATITQARRRARAMPWLGRYLASLEIHEDRPIAYERTDRRARGHFSLWGEPAELLASVGIVVPV